MAEQPTGMTATAHPASRLERVLGVVPRMLSSKPHIVLLVGLGVYLIVLPLLHIFTPSAGAELIGGNYTNVTSDIGACIAAGGTLHLIRQDRKRGLLEQERLRLASETHTLLHFVHRDAARSLGHVVPPDGVGVADGR